VIAPDQEALSKRIDTIEEAYEFFLAYASQGIPSDHPSASSSQIRQYLQRCEQALSGLGDVVVAFADGAGVTSGPHRAFAGVIDRDARDASAAIQLVLTLPANPGTAHSCKCCSAASRSC